MPEYCIPPNQNQTTYWPYRHPAGNAFSITVTNVGSTTQSAVDVALAPLAAYGNCASSIASPAMGVLRTTTSSAMWPHVCDNATTIDRYFLKSSGAPRCFSCSHR